MLNSNSFYSVFGAMLQVEIDGQVLGKGIGLTWDEAKMQVCYFFIYRVLFLGIQMISFVNFMHLYFSYVFLLFSNHLDLHFLRLLKRRLEL